MGEAMSRDCIINAATIAGVGLVAARAAGKAAAAFGHALPAAAAERLTLALCEAAEALVLRLDDPAAVDEAALERAAEDLGVRVARAVLGPPPGGGEA